MTNTLNTPVAALEHAYPLRVRHYGLRDGSGGAGRHRGGDGVICEIEPLGRARFTLISERRVSAPFGLQGGRAGLAGPNLLIRDGAQTELPAKVSVDARAGDRLRIETPGVGWGGPDA
jgi:N-methylhydantoinase B